MDPSVFADGIRFECTGCGDCCKSRGRFQYVYVTLAERRRLAQHLGMSTAAFTRQHCERTDGWYHLRDPKNDCRFLDGLRCTVYAARPEQCRTWPFWPDNMKRTVWEQEVKPGCPGVGRGRRYAAEEILMVLEREQRRSTQK
jgi:uncharacterized protein